MVQPYRPFERSEPDKRPLNSRPEVIARGREYRRTGAFRNALDLYRRFEITEEFAGLADDAWAARDLVTCLEVLREMRDVRRLLYCVDLLKPYGATAWLAAFRDAAAALEHADGNPSGGNESVAGAQHRVSNREPTSLR